MSNHIYYGDNLDVMRRFVRDETVDLCYIDPPFNSKRSYNQIYNNVGREDRAQAQAFVDTWTWDDHANECLEQIKSNANGVQTKQSIALISGLENVLGKSSLLAYLVSMTVRIAEIHRTLKPTGSFYLHCDPTASHYLKLICDAVFPAQGGDYLNELIWCYGERGLSKRYFNKKHDVIFLYSKSGNHTFNYKEAAQAYSDTTVKKFRHIEKSTGKRFRLRGRNVPEAGALRRQTDVPLYLEGEYTYRQYLEDSEGVLAQDWVEIDFLNQAAAERLGYPTQKPEALLELLLLASSNENDTVLDAYCGCGTTVAVANRLNRRWIGIDITYQSVSLVLKRLAETDRKAAEPQAISIHGIPKDLEAVDALIHKKDDRVRKEYEKWAVLTFTENRGMIREKKGADGGIDGTAYIGVGKDKFEPLIISVKSGKIGASEMRDLRGVVEREKAIGGVLITRHEPSKAMINEAKSAGQVKNDYLPPFDRLQIVTAEQIIEGKRLQLPTTAEVIKKAVSRGKQEVYQRGLSFQQ